MSYSMLGGTGMGAAGMGAGAGPAAAGGLSPQVMAMLRLMAMNQGSGGGAPGFAPPTGPTQAPTTGTPMAGLIGAPAGAMMQRPMMAPPVTQPPGMSQPGQPSATTNPIAAAAQTAQQYQRMQALMQQLKGGQTGVAPQLDPSQNPNSTAAAGSPGWLQSLMGMFGQGGMPAGAGPAGGLT